jgi:tetratricopeptide (TPR) repeat protein
VANEGFSPPVPVFPKATPQPLEDHLTVFDRAFFHPLPHIFTALIAVGMGFLLDGPFLAMIWGCATIMVSNFRMQRLLLRYFNRRSFRRFLAAAENVQDSFPWPYRPVTNLGELRALAHVRLDEAEKAKALFQSIQKDGLSPAARATFSNSLSVLYLELQDPHSALTILAEIDLNQISRNKMLLFCIHLNRAYAHLLNGHLKDVRASLEVASSHCPTPREWSTYVMSLQALLKLELDGDLSGALALSNQAMRQLDAQDTAWEAVLLTHTLITLEVTGDDNQSLELLSQLFQRGRELTHYQQAQFHYLMARVSYLSQDVPEALSHLDQATSLSISARLKDRIVQLKTAIAEGRALAPIQPPPLEITDASPEKPALPEAPASEAPEKPEA